MTVISRRLPRATDTARPPLPTEPSTLQIRRINAIYAALLWVLGPSDTPDGPLAGTRFDPELAAPRDHERAERRYVKSVARWQRWDARLHGHNPIPPPWWAEALDAADREATAHGQGSDLPHP